MPGTNILTVVSAVLIRMEVDSKVNGGSGGNLAEIQAPIQKQNSPFGGNGSSFLTFTIVFIVILQLYIKKGGKSKKLKNIDEGGEEILGFDDLPALKPWLPLKIIGNVPQLLPLSNFLKVAEKWSDEYGDIFTGSGLGQSFVVLNSGPNIKTILNSADFGHLTKAPIIYDPMKPFITNGLLVSKDAFWQKERKILLKSQSYQNLKANIEMLNRHSRAFVQDLDKLFEDGKPHQVNGAINTTFLAVINEMITGKPLENSNELVQYHHNFTIWKECLAKKILNPLLLLKPIWYFHPRYNEHSKAVDELFEFAKRRIKEHKEARANAAKSKELDDLSLSGSNDPSGDKPKCRSVLDELVDAGVSDQIVIDEFNTMMFGGHETGAGTIHFLLFLLALNQDIQKEARKEVNELFHNPSLYKNGKITYESVQMNLKYVERCIFETLRLFPPALFIARKLLTPLKIDYKGKTVILPTGVNVAVCPYLTQRREKYYPNPTKFDPDRFLPQNSEGRHAYSFIPFSAGPRNCLGLKFAMVEMKIVTAYLLRNFEITTTDKMEDIPVLPNTTLSPETDYTFVFKKRAHTVI